MIGGRVPDRAWDRPFDDPIVLPRRWLETLRDAGEYVARLPRKMKNQEHWRTAAEALLIAPEGRVPTRPISEEPETTKVGRGHHARDGIYQAYRIRSDGDERHADVFRKAAEGRHRLCAHQQTCHRY